MNELDMLRKQIDEIDREIVFLIEKRMLAAHKIGEYKKEHNLPILDTQREKQILESRMEMLTNNDIKPDVQELFAHIMQLSRSYQGGK